MNQQRNVIYAKRHHALMGERLGIDVTNMIYDTAEAIVAQAHEYLDYEGLKAEVLQVFAMEVPFTEEEFRAKKAKELSESVAEAAIETFKRKMDKLADIANPIIKNIYETKGQMYENVLIPITDGKRVYNIAANLRRAYETDCKEVVKEFEKRMLLYVIDDEWKEHLRQLDDLKQSVQNASYEQKDPLLIYKLESYNLFADMLNRLNRRALAILLRGQIPMNQRQSEDLRQAQTERRQDYSKYRTQKDNIENRAQHNAAQRDTRELQKPEPYRAEKKIGRNDPCPCGSGKKYKNCHGKNL